jgi:hypothetical protein
LADGTVADLAVAVADQPVEQLGQPDRGARPRLAFEDVEQDGVEPGDAGQVVATAPQQQVTHAAEAGVAGFGQGGDEQADELPPVPQRRAGQVLKPFDQGGVVPGLRGVDSDGRAAEQLEGGLPQIEGGQVPFRRRLGVVGAAVKLGQRQRQPCEQLGVDASHGALPVGTRTKLLQDTSRLVRAQRNNLREPRW